MSNTARKMILKTSEVRVGRVSRRKASSEEAASPLSEKCGEIREEKRKVIRRRVYNRRVGKDVEERAPQSSQWTIPFLTCHVR